MKERRQRRLHDSWAASNVCFAGPLSRRHVNEINFGFGSTDQTGNDQRSQNDRSTPKTDVVQPQPPPSNDTTYSKTARNFQSRSERGAPPVLGALLNSALAKGYRPAATSLSLERLQHGYPTMNLRGFDAYFFSCEPRSRKRQKGQSLFPLNAIFSNSSGERWSGVRYSWSPIDCRINFMSDWTPPACSKYS
jgi:hypothetical protein